MRFRMGFGAGAGELCGLRLESCGNFLESSLLLGRLGFSSRFGCDFDVEVCDRELSEEYDPMFSYIIYLEPFNFSWLFSFLDSSFSYVAGSDPCSLSASVNTS